MRPRAGSMQSPSSPLVRHTMGGGAMFNYPLLYVEHLSEHDLDLIAEAAGAEEAAARLRARLVERPELIDGLLATPRLFDLVFGRPEVAIGAQVTPFLTFGVLVNRSARDLQTASYVSEWAGPGRRLPVFDVASLREFLDGGGRRYFLIEHLTSFTRVASGSTWVKTRKGYRRRRYSELDLVRLAELVDQLPPTQRPAGYRRLGDVALFLAGVFPDHTATHPLTVSERERLSRSAGVSSTSAAAADRHLAFLESAGAGWYRRAVDAAAAVVGAGPEPLRDVASRFGTARRVLNFLADSYLYRFDSGLLRPTGC